MRICAFIEKNLGRIGKEIHVDDMERAIACTMCVGDYDAIEAKILNLEAR